VYLILRGAAGLVAAGAKETRTGVKRMNIDGAIAKRHSTKITWPYVPSRPAYEQLCVCEINLRLKQIASLESFGADIHGWLARHFSEILDPKKGPAVYSSDQVVVASLNLSNNHLQNLVVAFGNLKSDVQVLNLSRNLLRTAPALSQLTELRELNLSQNKLELIPSAITGMASLEKLDLSFNKIHQIKHALDGLVNLKVLCLQGNGFCELSGFEELQKLEELQLQRNNIQEASNLGLLSPTALTKLDISNNVIDDLEHLLPSLRALTALSSLSIKGNPCVDERNMYKVKIVDTCPSLSMLDSHRLGRILKDAARLNETAESYNENADQMDKLVSQTTTEFNMRLQSEAAYKDIILQLLNKKKMEIEDEFKAYEKSMYVSSSHHATLLQHHTASCTSQVPRAQ
jgi:hypothetical protein